MDRFIDQRYLFEEVILSTEKGILYQGKDLLLRRNVFLYMVKPKGNTSPEEYMKMVAGVSFLHDSNFFHILDVGVNSEGVYAVLEAREGEPLAHLISQHPWTASICISLVFSIGNGVQDALQKRIRGFSVTTDNIWITTHNEPIIINYWAEGDRQERGVAGLGACYSTCLRALKPSLRCNRDNKTYRSRLQKFLQNMLNRLVDCSSNQYSFNRNGLYLPFFTPCKVCGISSTNHAPINKAQKIGCPSAANSNYAFLTGHISFNWLYVAGYLA